MTALVMAPLTMVPLVLVPLVLVPLVLVPLVLVPLVMVPLVIVIPLVMVSPRGEGIGWGKSVFSLLCWKCSRGAQRRYILNPRCHRCWRDVTRVGRSWTSGHAFRNPELAG